MERLSKRVNRIIKLAEEAAREYEQDYVGTEHVLLAIAREGSGLGAKILIELGAEDEKIKAEVDKLVKASLEESWVFGRLPGTPHFKNVMARALEEARALQTKELCSEHLLLALLAEKGCVAHRALRALGLSSQAIREAIGRAATDSGVAE